MTNNDKQFFPGIPKIKYEGPASTNPLSFRHYNAEEVIYGKKMKDWLRFSVAFWHTFRGDGGDPFGAPTKVCARTGVCVCVCVFRRFENAPVQKATRSQPAGSMRHRRHQQATRFKQTTRKPPNRIKQTTNNNDKTTT